MLTRYALFCMSGSSPIQFDDVQKFHVYRALCDDLEGSDRVPEAITCFRKMQAELSEISVPDDQAEWEVGEWLQGRHRVTSENLPRFPTTLCHET
jgi:hypothetical protein